MSQPHDDRRHAPLSDGLIDRLVDGELDETARAAVLARLDADPTGWRRCALAFLEAQAWREALSATAEADAASRTAYFGPVVAPDEAHGLDSSRRGRARASSLRSQLGIAAAVLVAFAGGWLTSARSRAVGPAPTGVPGQVQAKRLDQEPQPAAPAPKLVKAEDRDGSEAAPVPVSLAQQDAYAGDARADLGLSRPVREQLEERGYRLEHRRALMSMDLNNGHTLAVPVDEVELRYVGNHVY